ncbi:hypothetical protein BU15DRAFT_68487 [Melanogaster broomeanus]|nr:hypothetical protein BU15DRAFT_68487 [Melanogaster broomeanus]
MGPPLPPWYWREPHAHDDGAVHEAANACRRGSECQPSENTPADNEGADDRGHSGPDNGTLTMENAQVSLPEVNAASISSAKVTQLKFWIDQVNMAAGKCMLTKSGRVDKLKAKLTAYYDLHLSTPVVPLAPIAAGPVSLTVNIQTCQWEYLHKLGDEWEDSVVLGRPFLLCGSSSACGIDLRLLEEAVASLSIQNENTTAIPTPSFTASTLPPVPTNDTIHGLLGAACMGDHGTHVMLKHFYHTLILLPSSPNPALQPMLTPASSLTGWSPSAHAIAGTPDTTPLTTPATLVTGLPLTATALSTLDESAILQACQAEFDALSRMSSLHDVITQVEEGRWPITLWEKVKVTVNRQEWLYMQLTSEFSGDKGQFLAFFTHQPSSESVLLKGKRKVSTKSLFPFRKIIKAIPRWDCDLEGERLQDLYRGNDGEFSETKWHQQWGLKNSWEVWRLMGMERID